MTVQPLPTVQFSATSSNGSESVSPANLPVTLSTATPHPIVFNFASTGGSAPSSNTDYFLPPITSYPVRPEAAMSAWSRAEPSPASSPA